MRSYIHCCHLLPMRPSGHGSNRSAPIHVSIFGRELTGMFEVRNPLITGMVAYFANSSTRTVLVCPDHDALIHTGRPHGRCPGSPPLARSAYPVALRKSACPPSSFIPTSNDMCVRVDAFSNIMASVLPARRGWGTPAFFCRFSFSHQQ